MSRAAGLAAGGRTAGQRLSPERLIPIVSGAIALVSIAVWVFNWIRSGHATAPPLRTSFGIAAASMLVMVLSYSVRRGLPAVRRLGRTQAYLVLHVYGGLLFLLFMLLHTSFQWPSGALNVTLWVVAMWVVVSGVLGFALQRSVPRVLDAASTFEVNLQRVPDLVVELRGRAEAVAAAAGAGVRAYYTRELAPDMASPRLSLSRALGRSRAEGYRAQEFEILRRTAPAAVAERLDELRQLHSTKLEIDLHYTLQNVLRLWLYLHIPAAVVLLGIAVLHIFTVLYY